MPYSWSFWGGVQEHADHQARALQSLGIEAKIVMGHDPPGRLTKLLHPEGGAACAASRIRHPGRAVGDRARQRVASEHHPLAARDAANAADLRGGALRRDPRARAVRADPVRLRARRGGLPDGRHLPCCRREARLVSDGQANVGNRGRAGRLPDRGLRGGAPGGGALRRRADRGDPERHLPARALRRGRARRQCRLHRAQRETKGPRGAAARMAGGRGQDERAPSCRGRRSAFGALACPPAGALAGAGGSPRRPLRGGADAASSRRRASFARPHSAARASAWC